MTKEELDAIFTKNYKYYRTSTNNHNYKLKYDLDVVMSNQYINLCKNIDKLHTENDVTAFIARFAYSLKIYTQNRHPFLTEESKLHNFTDRDIIIDGDSYDEDNISFQLISDKDMDTYNIYVQLKEKYKNTLSIEDSLLFTDYLNGVDNKKKVMEYYSLGITYSGRVLRQMKILYTEFEEYMLSEIKNNKINIIY